MPSIASHYPKRCSGGHIMLLPHPEAKGEAPIFITRNLVEAIMAEAMPEATKEKKPPQIVWEEI